MQAVDIQQDAIFQIHKATVGAGLTVPAGSAWAQLRDTRHLCAGHPASRKHGVPAPQRTFMGRSFGNYDRIQYELWDASTGLTTHPSFNLRQMINSYDVEASADSRPLLPLPTFLFNCCHRKEPESHSGSL
jgi:hypothetical protein